MPPTAPSHEPLQSRSARSTPKRRTSSTTSTRSCRTSTKAATGAIDVYTTLDLHLQRLAQDAVRDGLARVDELLAKRKRQRAQAALIAVDPRTGEILAFVGGRSYNQSQYNRAIAAKRQPGSVFKPFVYLAAFERAAAEGRTDVTPATRRHRRADDVRVQRADVDAGQLRRRVRRADHAPARAGPLAQHRDHQGRGDGRLRPGRRAVEARRRRHAAAPVSVDRARRVRGDAVRDRDRLHAVSQRRHAQTAARDLRDHATPARTCRCRSTAAETIARPDTTFLVTNMMRSVLNEGTGAGARAAGFTLDAAGKTGTTNDLRDAWFVGFTPELLTVVWVGLDDNQPLGLSGTQAALPIWTEFMMRALAGRRERAVRSAGGIVVRRHRPRHRQARRPRLPARRSTRRSSPAPSRPRRARCTASRTGRRDEAQ